MVVRTVRKRFISHFIMFSIRFEGFFFHGLNLLIRVGFTFIVYVESGGKAFYLLLYVRNIENFDVIAYVFL